MACNRSRRTRTFGQTLYRRGHSLIYSHVASPQRDSNPPVELRRLASDPSMGQSFNENSRLVKSPGRSSSGNRTLSWSLEDSGPTPSAEPDTDRAPARNRTEILRVAAACLAIRLQAHGEPLQGFEPCSLPYQGSVSTDEHQRGNRVIGSGKRTRTSTAGSKVPRPAIRRSRIVENWYPMRESNPLLRLERPRS